MKLGFRESLEHYGDVAKKMESAPAQDLGRLSNVLDYFIQYAVEHSGTSENTQFEIFTIQQEKQRIMARLKAELKKLHDPEAKFERRPGKRFVYAHGDQLFWSPEHGNDVPVTEGEILTDGEWGLDYELDPETVPLLLRKELLIREAKRKLMDLADQQIIKHETAKPDLHELKRRAYEGSARDKKEKKFVSGWVAEKMVKNFLTKLAIDQGLDIEVLETDIYQDVDQKIDFVIRRKSHRRGVEVETLPMTERLGIQFTTDPRPETAVRKEQQIRNAKRRLEKSDKVDDIVLVRIQFGYVSDIFNEWNKTQAPGGPDKLLSQDIKEQIREQLLTGLFSPEEITDRQAA